ncbi:MAG: PAS domain-containing protein [Myxococcales bacterium]
MPTRIVLRRLPLFLLVLFGCLPPQNAEAESRLRVGLYRNSPKLDIDAAGQPTGIFVDILEAIAHEEKWSIEYVRCAFDECLKLLEAGRIDLLPDVAFNEERAERFALNQETVLSSWSQLYAPPSSNIRSLPDVNGRRLAVLAGSIQAEELTKLAQAFDVDLEVVPFPDFPSAFRAVAEGRADAVATNRFYGDQHARGAGLKDTFIVFNPVRLHFAAAKQGDPALLDAIDKRLRALKSDPGSPYYRTLQRWTLGSRSSPLPTWILSSALGLLTALAIGLAWVFLLRRQVAARTAELGQANALLDTIIESIPDTVVLKDCELRLLRINRAGEKLLGRSREALLGKTNDELFTKEEADAFNRADREALAGRKPLDIPEEVVQAGEHGERILHTRKVPILDEAGELRFLLGISEDITERRRVEAQLCESTALLGIAQRIARLGGWSVELATNRVTWSDEIAAIHEVPQGRSLSLEDWLNFFAPEWRERIAEVFGDCSKQGTAFDEEMEIVTTGGRRVWVRVIGEAVRDSSGAIHRLQGAFQEITDRKQAEEERRKLQEQLLASQKVEAIGQLAGGVAHDFNNLLAVILSCAEGALCTVAKDDPLREDLEEILRAGERAASLTRQLLAFSRKQVLHLEVLRLDKVIAEAEAILQRLLGEDIELSVQVAEDLGCVRADHGQLTQVVMNLAINARDAMPEGGKLVIEAANIELDEKAALEYPGASPGPYVMLSLTDTGSGMAPETLERIFEPFFATKEKGKGTGLGLAMVYGIVNQSAGSLRVQSELGRGSRFEVLLPRADAAATAPAKPAESAVSRGSETVLIVEDEPTVRKTAERVLRTAGYTVLTAASGGDALVLCEKHLASIDLLLTDVVMPQMSGRALSERLSSLRPELKTLYMSGYTDDALRQHDVFAPGKGFITKPFSAATLTRKVRELLDAS